MIKDQRLSIVDIDLEMAVNQGIDQNSIPAKAARLIPVNDEREGINIPYSKEGRSGGKSEEQDQILLEPYTYLLQKKIFILHLRSEIINIDFKIHKTD